MRVIRLLPFFFLISCSNDIREVDKLLSKKQILSEIATNVEILYSDSAIVKVRILSPTLKRYTHKGQSYDEFPDGLKVEFLDPNQRVKSWLVADYAVRKDKEKKIFVEQNVVLYNNHQDKLETPELVWDEEAEEIYTNQHVKISQPSRGDTSYGFGFKADQDFTRFEIKRKFQGIKNIDELTSALEK